MSTLKLREGAPSQIVSLTNAEANALEASELVDIHFTAEQGRWEVQAGRKVGIARMGERTVIVEPKVSPARMLFMMGYAQKPDFWRDEHVTVDPQLELLPAMAEAFARLAAQALGQGLLQGYITTDEASLVLRGRLRTSEQISRRFGMAIPLEITYDDYTMDIAENRILLSAVLRLLTLPRLSPLARKRLLHLKLQLIDATPLTKGAPIPKWQASRLNLRYQPALHFAELVLAGGSFEHEVGNLTITGYSFDMWKIFEDFVCVALKESLALRGLTGLLQSGVALDLAGNVGMKPDFVVRDGTETIAVADSKYKMEKPSGFPHADVYQLLAYCTALRLSAGHLIYAKGESDVITHTIENAGVRISCHVLDIAKEPAALLSAIDDLAAVIVSPRLISSLGKSE